MLWGKTDKIRQELAIMASLSVEGIEEFSRAMNHWAMNGRDEQFDFACDQVKQKEEASDQQVFMITQQLYSEFLLPDSREDLSRLLHEADSIIDEALHCLRFIQTRRLDMSKDISEKLTELLQVTEECVQKTAEALRLILGPRESEQIKHLTQEVGNIETLCDKLQGKSISLIFEVKNPTVQHMLLAEMIDRVGNISDACEDTAMIMNIINMKRLA